MNLEYKITVTREEIRSVSVSDLLQERRYRLGQSHRKANLPCSSSSGAYLNGWYAPDDGPHYIPKEAEHLLAQFDEKQG